MAAKLEESIAGLEERLKQLKVRKVRIDQRQRSLSSKRERASDTRRKILVGALVLAQVENGEHPRENLYSALDRYLTREDDRKLFELGARS
jgi:hypothetical protein